MTTSLKIKKATFKHVESELYSYHDTLREIDQLTKDIMFTRPTDDENIGGGKSNLPSQPTERIATTLTTHKLLTRMQEITHKIEKVYTSLPEDYQKLIRIRYWTRPQTLTWDGIAAKLHVNRATAIRWRDQIVLLIADELGWR